MGLSRAITTATVVRWTWTAVNAFSERVSSRLTGFVWTPRQMLSNQPLRMLSADAPTGRRDGPGAGVTRSTHHSPRHDRVEIRKPRIRTRCCTRRPWGCLACLMSLSALLCLRRCVCFALMCRECAPRSTDTTLRCPRWPTASFPRSPQRHPVRSLRLHTESCRASSSWRGSNRFGRASFAAAPSASSYSIRR